jgi:2-oxoisovalerate dehydrogenase E1 component
MIISHVTGKPDLWNEMISPPILVSKANVMIGYNQIYEYAALPDVHIVAAIKKSVSTIHERAPVAAGVEPRPR